MLRPLPREDAHWRCRRELWQGGQRALLQCSHPCFVLQHLPEPAVSSGARYVPVPSSYTTGEARVTLLILGDLLHFQLSGSEKEAVDSEWVLPSHGELLAFTWFP